MAASATTTSLETYLARRPLDTSGELEEAIRAVRGSSLSEKRAFIQRYFEEMPIWRIRKRRQLTKTLKLIEAAEDNAFVYAETACQIVLRHYEEERKNPACICDIKELNEIPRVRMRISEACAKAYQQINVALETASEKERQALLDYQQRIVDCVEYYKSWPHR